ncbi:MAG: glycerophosphodiester phosphodiesterase family protein [Kiritimatiellae bacterium]|jgi:glycerophosphoryl diester phosphodiesterase|nr:glycerophosphodiester phosphodiesterase family protein [Kiritimatiellia bacterium]
MDFINSAACKAALLIFCLFRGVLSASAVLLTAHRGASHDAPENTLAAFNLAWEKGADGIEGDFYLTSDGHIVCIHDASTKRTGDTNLTVSASTLAELKAVDVGSYKGKQWAGERIPTFQEVIATIPAGKYIHVELKMGVEIVEPIAKILEESSLTSDQIIIICFNKEVVAAAKKRLPDCRVLWLVSIKDEGPSAEEVLEVLKTTGADGVATSANAKVIDKDYVRTVQANGSYKFNVWTVNSGGLAVQFKEMGLEAITTDRPAYLRFCLRDVPLTEPVTHWTFDKSSSNSGSAGSAYNSVFHNSPVYIKGRSGSAALALDGVDDYTSVAYTLPDQGSIAFWYYARPWYNFQSIFDNSVDENDWEMWIDEKGFLWSRIESGKGQVGCNLNKLEGSNCWYHIIFSWDKANDITSLCVNGKERSSSAIKDGWVNPGKTFYLGGGNKGNTPGNGMFDDFRIYDMMLTPIHVQKIYREQL